MDTGTIRQLAHLSYLNLGTFLSTQYTEIAQSGTCSGTKTLKCRNKSPICWVHTRFLLKLCRPKIVPKLILFPCTTRQVNTQGFFPTQKQGYSLSNSAPAKTTEQTSGKKTQNLNRNKTPAHIFDWQLYEVFCFFL